MTTDATNEAPLTLPAGPPPSRAKALALAAGRLALRLACDLLIIAAAVESWLAGSPIRAALAAGTLLYFLLTAYVVSKGGRVGGRGWLMDPLAGAILFLGFLVTSTWTPDWTTHGVVVARQATPVVLAASMAVLAAAAALRIAGPAGMSSWAIRIPALLVCGYACASFGRGIADRTPFVDLLTGHAFWLRLPSWGQGAWLGAFLVLPAAFLRELGASIARLAVVPHLRWLFIFGLGIWIAFNVASF